MSATATAEKKPGKGTKKKSAPVQLVETASSNGRGQHAEAVPTKALAAAVIRVTRTKYVQKLDGMNECINDLLQVAEAFDLMRLDPTEEEVTLRKQVKHFAVQNSERGDQTEEAQSLIYRTNSKMVRLRGMYEARIDAEIAESFERFNEFVIDIQKERPELLQEIASDLAGSQQAYRNALIAETTYVGVAMAYASVNDLLEDTIQQIEDEKERKRLEGVRDSIKSSASKL